MKSLKEIIDKLIELNLTYFNSGIMSEEEQKKLKDLIIQYQIYYEYDLTKMYNGDKVWLYVTLYFIYLFRLVKSNLFTIV